MRSGKLIEETRFADPWFTHYGNYLAVPDACLLQSLPERMHLGITSYEARKSTCRCGFHARSNERSSNNFINLNRFGQSPNWNGPKRFYLYIAFSQSKGISSD